MIFIDRVAVLVFLYLKTAFTDLVSRADHGGLDGLLIPGINPNIRVRRVYS